MSPSYDLDALELSLKLMTNLFIYDNAPHVSSKRAIRLPGVLCFSVSNPVFKNVKTQVESINSLKTAFRYCDERVWYFERRTFLILSIIS